MLTSAANVEDLVEALEVRFLANRDTHLHFGLLTDFPDASAESLGTDAHLLALAEERINELNQKYGHVTPARRESWNGSENFRARFRIRTPAPAKQMPGYPGTVARSTCSTAPDAGMRRRRSGWARNASAASLAT